MSQPPVPPPPYGYPVQQPKPKSKALWIILGTVGGVILLCCGIGGILVATSGDDTDTGTKTSVSGKAKDDQPKAPNTKDAAKEPEPNEDDSDLSLGGEAEIEVDGKAYNGVDLELVTCIKQDGDIILSSASVELDKGVSALMKDGNPPTVESLSIVVDDIVLSVASSGGVSMGSAAVTVDGDRYTITGKAVGADTSDMSAGMITKSFKIAVTCE